MKRLVALVLIIVLIFSISTAAALSELEPVDYQISDLIEIAQEQGMESAYNVLLTMDNDELNTLIDTIASSSIYVQEDSVQDYMDGIRVAWLAAAAAASNLGYNCAAKLVEQSVFGNDYSETDGICAAKIETTAAFANWRNSPSNTDIVFNRSDNADLFFALHDAEAILAGNSSGGRAVIIDIFDFAQAEYLGDVLVDVINNWAWLCQNASILNSIDVTIYVTL